MKFPLHVLSLGAASALLLALAAPTPLPAQAAPPAGADSTSTGGLRRLDQPAAAPENTDADPAAATPAPRNTRRTVFRSDRDVRDQRVAFFNDLHIEKDERIGGQAVVIGGDLTVDGEVENQTVTIMGDAKINGVVHGQVVCVLGNVVLGPHAHIDGQVVCTGGTIDKDPGAYVGGQIVQNSFGRHAEGFGPALRAWYYECALKGRPLAFGPHLGWLWMWTVGAIAFYVILALIFPAGIRRCGDTLVQRPGLVILSAVLSCVAIPVLFVLLIITVVGIPVAFLLPLGIVIAIAFGKTSLFALIGRRIALDRLPPAVAVLIGAVICVLIYTAPFLGTLVSVLLSALALGCSVTALFTSSRTSGPSATPGPAPVPPAMPIAAEPASIVSPPPVAAPVDILPPPAVLPPVASVSLPRAGFWIRTAALLVDVILVGLIAHLLPRFDRSFAYGRFEEVRFTTANSIFLLLPAYAVVLWKLRGSTIGGIVFRLKVVRLDGRPIDWATAIVRGLGSYLSFVCVGLGFIWVVFDSERQSWHDKIAGTTVVHPPHGISLV